MKAKNKAVFLDRDGVVNQEMGDYTYKPSQLHLNLGIKEFIISAKAKGYLLVVITNQGGIAKGLYTWDDVQLIHSLIQKDLGPTAEIDKFYVSVHHDLIGESLDRKPNSLMLERAIHHFNIDVNQSIMIGDKDSDVAAARKVGIKGLKIDANTNLLDLDISL